MTLSTEAKERLSDIVERQPTKNGDLQDEWGMDSGSDVHSYLESELKEYYYRNEDSLICATPEGMKLVGEGDGLEGGRTVRGNAIQDAIVTVLPGPDEESQSVVATLQDLRDEDFDTDVDSVRSALHTLSDKGVTERISKTVPTFRLALERNDIVIETDE